MFRKIFAGFIVLVFVVSCSNVDVQKEQLYVEEIDSLLNLMTLEEKVAMIHASSSFTSGGVERLGIPEIVMSDGPHGVRHEHGRDWDADFAGNDSATYLPTAIALASTWNRDLGYRYGVVLGEEAKARDKDIILGPGVNIIRSPLNGRNFEYLSEDPYLTTQMAVGYIKGVQEQGVATSVKHYIANNQEVDRHETDVQIDEQALREIYLPAFKAAVVDANAATVMGAYNKVRGQYCTHHEYLINTVLREEFGFEGLVVSDWGAVHDTREALLYGTDIEMGSDIRMIPNIDYDKFYLADSAISMVQSDLVDESYVDEKVRRILKFMFEYNLFEEKSSSKINTPEHQELALKVAEEGIVLLKNTDMLPLQKKQLKKLAVIGHNAIRKHAGEGGSSQVNALYEITPLEGIRNMLGEDVELVFAEGYFPTEENTSDEAKAAEAVSVAKDADAVIYVGGWIHNVGPSMWANKAYDCENQDKEDIKLAFGQEELIKRIAAVNENVSVVIMGGSNVSMRAWMDDVKSILQVWYPGMEGGKAIARILFGETNPSGKLPMTFADTHMEYPSHSVGSYDSDTKLAYYDEGIYVGYRYFDKEQKEPVYPFGHGLSYTTFGYDELDVSVKKGVLKVSFAVENTGDMDGAEVAQVYIGKVDSQGNRPVKELKGFEKRVILAGGQEMISVEIAVDELKYYSNEAGGWVSEGGEYEVFVGSSSRDIKLKGSFSL